MERLAMVEGMGDKDKRMTKNRQKKKNLVVGSLEILVSGFLFFYM